MKKGIYAIYDNKAQDCIGILQTHGHEAVAIRTFTDITLMPDSQIHKHPEDFDLIQLGFLNTGEGNPGITSAYRTILKGATLVATLQRPPTNQQQEGS